MASALSCNLARMMGGDVTVPSEPARVRCTVRLPLRARRGKILFATISARSRPSGINLVTPRPRLHVLLLPLEACVQRKQFFDATRCRQFGLDSGRALGNWALDANPTWLRLIERCPGLGHARFAEAGPLDLKWRCPSTSLRLLPRIVLRVDVGKSTCRPS